MCAEDKQRDLKNEFFDNIVNQKLIQTNSAFNIIILMKCFGHPSSIKKTTQISPVS